MELGYLVEDKWYGEGDKVEGAREIKSEISYKRSRGKKSYLFLIHIDIRFGYTIMISQCRRHCQWGLSVISQFSDI